MSNVTKTNGKLGGGGLPFNIELIVGRTIRHGRPTGGAWPQAESVLRGRVGAIARDQLYVNTTENQIKGTVSFPTDKENTVKLYKAESGPVRPVLRKCYSRVSGGGEGGGHSLVSYVVASRYE